MKRSHSGRHVAAVVVSIVIGAVGGAAAMAAAQNPEIGPAPGRLVDVGGRRLHLHCMGSGSPTGIIEAGASSFSLDFALVQPEVA